MNIFLIVLYGAVSYLAGIYIGYGMAKKRYDDGIIRYVLEDK